MFIGILFLGVEIFKNQQKAKLVLVEQRDIRKNYQYNLIDSEETRGATLELATVIEI